jgi:2-hydroxy-3-keto-5-methylthiopentenyl-1-phosphate phosphatase
MRMHPRYRVFIDFDGTLVVPNVAILLVERFCPDGATVAHEVDQLLHTGKITLREAWDRQTALLPADRLAEMTQWAVDTVPLREGAREFVDLLHDEQIPAAVVSGGLDFYIRAVLDREEIRLPFLSDSLDRSQPGSVRVTHPFGHPTCRLCGICKAQVVRSRSSAAELTVFLGDGSTDRYGAEVADIVFARHRLKTYCEQSRVPFVPFDDFRSVTAQFRRWLDGTDPTPIRSALGLSSSPCPISRELADRPAVSALADRAPGAPRGPVGMSAPTVSVSLSTSQELEGR